MMRCPLESCVSRRFRVAIARISIVAFMSAALRAYADRGPTAEAEGGSTSTAAVALDEDTGPLCGKRVTIGGLLARPDLNGLVGSAIAFAAATGRYTVQINDEELALKPTNLQEVKRNDADATAFSSGTKVRIKGLAAKPELNGCGATVLEWNSEKERYAVKLDGSLKDMLLRTTNLERDKREAWTPAMHDPATTKHIAAEMERVVAENMKNANPFAAMGLDEEMIEQINSRKKER